MLEWTVLIEVRDSPERDIWFLHVMLQGSYQMGRVLGTPPSSPPPSSGKCPNMRNCALFHKCAQFQNILPEAIPSKKQQSQNILPEAIPSKKQQSQNILLTYGLKMTLETEVGRIFSKNRKSQAPDVADRSVSSSQYDRNHFFYFISIENGPKSIFPMNFAENCPKSLTSIAFGRVLYTLMFFRILFLSK